MSFVRMLAYAGLVLEFGNRGILGVPPRSICGCLPWPFNPFQGCACPSTYGHPVGINGIPKSFSLYLEASVNHLWTTTMEMTMDNIVMRRLCTICSKPILRMRTARSPAGAGGMEGLEKGQIALHSSSLNITRRWLSRWFQPKTLAAGLFIEWKMKGFPFVFMRLGACILRYTWGAANVIKNKN